MKISCFRLLAACALGCALAPVASAQLRVVTWNVTNYTSGRVADFQTAIYSEFDGRSMSPDVFIGQEFLSQTGVNNFLSILNTAPGSPGDWAAAPFVNGPDTDNAFFYRTSKVSFLGHTVVSTGSVSPNHPRNLDRYDIKLNGYTADSAVIACYSTHMKAGSGSNDQSRRLEEAQEMRDDSEALPAGWNFVVGGDFNIQRSSQSAYQWMVGSQANNDGRFFDPISRPGSWNNSSTYRTLHTQDPSGAGGMDDRHDQILVSGSLVDGDGLDYLGDPGVPYSLSTWDDPNHSYRSWGNDGTSYNGSLATTGNTMVGPTIAQALKTTASGGGHLPVFLDLLVPALVGSDSSIDFGDVTQNTLALMSLSVFNDGDLALWSADGINALDYSLSAGAGATAPGGSFSHDAGDAPNAHSIFIDTSVIGPFASTVTILSNDPDTPARVVTLSANIVSACVWDLDGDGSVGSTDLASLLGVWTSADLQADFDGDGSVGAGDLAILIGNWGPCP